MTTQTYLDAAIRQFLANSDTQSISVAAAHMHPADLAHAFSTLEAGDIARVLAALPVEIAARTLGYLEEDLQTQTAEALPRKTLGQLLAAMSHDERADLYALLAQDVQHALLPALAMADREDIRKLAAYEEGTAGSVMTSDYAVLAPDLTTTEAIARLRQEAPNKETIYDAYVVDDQRRLVGVVSLRDLITGDDDARVSEIMKSQVISIRADAPREDAARTIARYDLLALPVTNGGEALVGIITADDAMDVAADEATEDFFRAGGVQGVVGHRGEPDGASITSVRKAGIWVLYRLRIVWLVLLVFGNIFSGAGIAYFEDTIMAYVALVFFLPLLIDSGGNAGSQAATLMVRGLAVGDVKLTDWGHMIGREVAVALMLGLTMAVAVSLVGAFRAPEVVPVVAMSMVCIVLVGSTIGMSLPFILSRLKLDPAAASAPLITSIADAAGVLIYFSIATAVLDLGPAAV
ncbi:MAG: magnesium transporter [Oceanicaulis sp.]|nr:magnesium transporter [Oceanicaulis sp.]